MISETNSGEKKKPADPRWTPLVQLQQLGYNLIPCIGKKAAEEWKGYQETRIPNAVYKKWIRERPGCNWALLTGAKPYSAAPGLIVVDCDDRAALAVAEQRCPATPVRQRTGKGGCHLFYRRPDDLEIVANRVGTTIDGQKYKIDIRADGGYVMAPRSVHPETGQRYKEIGVEIWTRELFEKIPLYDPAWLPDEKAAGNNRLENAEENGAGISAELNGDFPGSAGNAEICKFQEPEIDVPIGERVEQARQHLAKCPGSQQGKGNGADNYCFALAVDVIHGFALRENMGAALDVMKEWGQRPDNIDAKGWPFPWTTGQLKHKLRDAWHATYSGRYGDKLQGIGRAAIIGAEVQAARLLCEVDGPMVAPASITASAVVAAPPVAEQSAELAGTTTTGAGDNGEHDPGDEPGSFDPPQVVKQRATEQPRREYKFAPLNSADFAAATYNVEWLIRSMLVMRQPCIVGGPKKSLKTNIITDLAISLGSGRPFLNQFPVRQSSVCFISGESGEATIQETANRICRAKGIKLAGVNCWWDFRLPKVSIPEQLAELSAGLARLAIEVAIIDPIYLCLMAGGGGEKDARNLFDMGELYAEVSDACLAVGTTPILIHHARKSLAKPFEPLELEDLAYAGVAEHTRQWLLINRRRRYEPGQPHQLWLAAGGSVGHGKLLGLDIDEGVLQDDFTGRVWNVSIRNLDECKAERAEGRQEQQRVKAQGKKLDNQTELLEALDDCESPPTKSQLVKQLGWGWSRFNTTFADLDGSIIELIPGKVECGNGAEQEGSLIRRREHPSATPQHRTGVAGA